MSERLENTRLCSDEVLVFERSRDVDESWIAARATELGDWMDVGHRADFVDRLKRDGVVRDFETSFVTKSGEERTIELAGETIEFGEDSRVLLAFRDITERKEMEHLLLHAQKMEAVGQLTGGIAHDFNNMLQIIQGSVSMAKICLEKGDKATKHLDTIGDTIVRAAKLTQRLLSFSRKQAIHQETVDPNEVIGDMLEIIERTLGEDLEIEADLDEGVPSITIDRNGLENAILNLAINARAAMPEGGNLTFSVGGKDIGHEFATEAESFPAGKYVEISVRDTGAGMSPETLDRACEAFYTTKKVGEGSGLGLSTVCGFVRQSGGHLALESEVGKGTCIRLLLPISKASEKGSGQQKDLTKIDVGRCAGVVLVVEDDSSVRESTAMILRAIGYDTREAANGAAALGILNRNPDINLMFSDVVMPEGMTGVALAQEATRRHDGLGVVLTSGYPVAELKKAGLLAGGYTLLKKPYSNAELSDALRGARGNRAKSALSAGASLVSACGHS